MGWTSRTALCQFFFFFLIWIVRSMNHTPTGKYGKVYYLLHGTFWREQRGLPSWSENGLKEPGMGVGLGDFPACRLELHGVDFPLVAKEQLSLLISFVQMWDRKGRRSGEAWELSAIKHWKLSQTLHYSGQEVGRQRWGGQKAAGICAPLTVLRIREDVPSIPQSFRDLGSLEGFERLTWGVWKIKEKKKENGKFPPLSLNVGRSFSCCPYQKSRALLEVLSVLVNAPFQVLGCLESRAWDQGEKSGELITTLVVLQISIFSPSHLLLFTSLSKYLLLIFCPGCVTAFSGRDNVS